MDRRLQELGVGREGDVLRLHRGVHRDPRQVALLQGAGIVSEAQGLLQQNVQVIADTFAPMAQTRTLVLELVLEERLAGEVLEIGIMYPALPHLLVREPVGVLQQEQAEHETHRLRRTALVGKISRQLIVEPDPVDPVGQDDKRVLHVDDLVEAAAEQVVMPRFLLLFRSHVIPQLQYRQRITNGPENISQIARKPPSKPRFPANSINSKQRKYSDCQRHSGSSQGTC